MLPEVQVVPWLALFKYPRSLVASILTGLSQTGSVGLALWQVTLLVLLLNVPPAQAAYLSIWIALIGIGGRAFGAWLSDLMGRRYGGALCCLLSTITMLGAGYLHTAFIGGVSVFYLMLLANSFFANGNFAVVFPYMAELWPARLRASGFGLVYGLSNLGKFIGPAGLAVIAGASNFVAPQATLDALVPGFEYFAAWYALGIIGFLFVGIETRGRTIAEAERGTGAAGAGEGGGAVEGSGGVAFASPGSGLRRLIPAREKSDPCVMAGLGPATHDFAVATSKVVGGRP